MIKLICRIAKSGNARYIAHLDTQRVLQRALRRSGVPVAYTQGFNPHAQLSFALALSLGSASAGEYCTLSLAEDMSPAAFFACFAPALPPGFGLAACGVTAGKPTVSEWMHSAEYTVALPDWPPEQVDVLSAAVGALLTQPEIVVEKKGKAGVRQVDIRPQVFSLSAGGNELRMRLYTAADGAITPKHLLPPLLALAGQPDAFWLACREDLFTLDGRSVLIAAATDIAYGEGERA